MVFAGSSPFGIVGSARSPCVAAEVMACGVLTAAFFFSTGTVACVLGAIFFLEEVVVDRSGLLVGCSAFFRGMFFSAVQFTLLSASGACSSEWTEMDCAVVFLMDGAFISAAAAGAVASGDASVAELKGIDRSRSMISSDRGSACSMAPTALCCSVEPVPYQASPPTSINATAPAIHMALFPPPRSASISLRAPCQSAS